MAFSPLCTWQPSSHFSFFLSSPSLSNDFSPVFAPLLPSTLKQSARKYRFNYSILLNSAFHDHVRSFSARAIASARSWLPRVLDQAWLTSFFLRSIPPSLLCALARFFPRFCIRRRSLSPRRAARREKERRFSDRPGEGLVSPRVSSSKRVLRPG